MTHSPHRPRSSDNSAVQNPMMSVAELATALTGATAPVVLDVQWVLGKPGAGRESFAAAHVPAARFCDLDTVLAGPVCDTGGRHPLPETQVLQRDLRSLGVRGSAPVVVYDAGDGYAAARAWWVLTWAGHRDVRVLDGGLRAWRADKHPVIAGRPDAIEPGDFEVQAGALPTIDAERVLSFVKDGGALLDARSPERYRGEREPVDPEAGHIPGALNLPTTAIVDETGRYLPEDAMRTVVDDVRGRALDGERVATDAPVAVYCGSGVTAAHVILGLRRAGIDAALYPGSWSDWITDPERPRATG